MFSVFGKLTNVRDRVGRVSVHTITFVHWSLSSSHQLTQISRSQTALFGMLRTALLEQASSSYSSSSLPVAAASSSRPALLHHHARILDLLLLFLMSFFTLVLKHFFSQSLFLHSHSLFEADLEFDHSVYGGHWRWLCWWMRQIKPTQRASGRIIIKIGLYAYSYLLS